MKPRDEATQVEDRFNAHRFWDGQFLTTYGLCPGAGKTALAQYCGDMDAYINKAFKLKEPIAPLVINRIKPYVPTREGFLDIESNPFRLDTPDRLAKEVWAKHLYEMAFRESPLKGLFAHIERKKQLLLLCK